MTPRKLYEALLSNEYPCPGSHRLDGVRGDPYEYPEDMMDVLGYHPSWSYETMAERHPGEFRYLQRMMARNWVEDGKCKEQIEIVMEYEGEYGTYAYLAAYGPCVEALGLDEDDYQHPIWYRVMERRRLRKLLEPESEAVFRIRDFVRREEIFVGRT